MSKSHHAALSGADRFERKARRRNRRTATTRVESTRRQAVAAALTEW